VSREKWLIFAIFFLALTVLFSGVWIGNSIISASKITAPISKVQSNNEDILSFSEAAVYLYLSEDELKWLLDKSHLKDGKGIPYYKIGQKILFSKVALSKWIINNAENRFDY
jgi:hypothetical protein